MGLWKSMGSYNDWRFKIHGYVCFDVLLNSISDVLGCSLVHKVPKVIFFEGFVGYDYAIERNCS